ncbi:TPA: SAV1978 family virulence-associated passenger protein [Staphylococcus pseudintermedius]
MKQFFGNKRYLYQNGRKVAHIHIVNGIYHFHGHFKTRLKLEFKYEQEFNNYIEKYELRFKE